MWSLLVSIREATWAGIGVFLAGLGTALSGWAAYRAMKKRNSTKEEERGD